MSKDGPGAPRHRASGCRGACLWGLPDRFCVPFLPVDLEQAAERLAVGPAGKPDAQPDVGAAHARTLLQHGRKRDGRLGIDGVRPSLADRGPEAETECEAEVTAEITLEISVLVQGVPIPTV